MASIPIPSGPRVAAGGAGTVLAPPQQFLDAGIAGTAAGQGAAIGQGLRQFGQDLGAAGQDAAQQALREQALVNEAMARDADSLAATNMANVYNEFAVLEGEKAVAAKDQFMAKMADARKAAVDNMPNPETKRMLDAVVTRRMGFYQESIGRYAAQQQKAWQARSAQGAARVAQDQAAVFRNMPALAEGLIESGVQQIGALGEIHGWDADTMTAEAAKYRGNAYQMLVSQLLGDGKVDEASAMFDRVRNRLDAGAQAQIAQMLKPQQQRQQTQMDFATVLPPRGAAGAVTMFDAFFGQESNFGRDPRARANVMQIQPRTWAQWAQPGEDPNDRDTNMAVGRRIIDAYAQQYGGDPARVAVAYFSGPENVAPPGSPTPWKEDRQDRNGKTVSRYVADIERRLARGGEAAPAYERPDFEGARERAAAKWGDDPERLTRVLARIGQAETQFNSTTKVERDGLKARLVDVSAALSDGRAVAIPEADIRRLYPKHQADEIVGQMNEAQQQGYAMQAVALASPSEFAALLAGYDDVGRPGEQGDETVRPGYAERAKHRERLLKAWQQRGEQIKKDPAVFAGRAPAVAALATEEALARPGGPEAYVQATLAEQERLGVPEADRRSFPKERIAALVQKVMEADPEKTPAALVLDEIVKQYGAAGPAVFRDMVRGGLPPEYAILGSMSHPNQVGARGDAQRMLAFAATKGGEKALREAVGNQTEAKWIDDKVDDWLADFYATARNDTGAEDLRATMRSFVRQMGYYYAGRGASGRKALRLAVDGVLNAKYDFDGTMRVPKGQMDLAREVTSLVQSRLTEADLAPVPEGPIAAEQRANLARVANAGFWVPNADDTGLVLMGKYLVAETGIPVHMPVRRAGGERVEVKFTDMPMLRDTLRATAPAAGTPASLREGLRRARGEAAGEPRP